MLRRLKSTVPACALGLALSACAYSPAEPQPPTPTPTMDEERPIEPEGAVMLEWDRPSERLSGSELEADEIAQYRIYYGTEPGTYGEVVELEPDASLPHTITGLEPGERYYFAITAVDREGRESPRSDPIALTAREPAQESMQASAEAE